MRAFIDWLGGRKWVAFLLMLALTAALVFGGFIKSEQIIRDLLVGLLAVYGTANVGHRVAERAKRKESEQ